MEEKFKKYYPFPLHVDEIIPFKTMCNGKGLDMAYDVVWAKFERPVYEELVDNGEPQTCQSKVIV